jgi:hypothetical protein
MKLKYSTDLFAEKGNEAIMKMLKRSNVGRFVFDDKMQEIDNDIRIALESIFDKHKDVVPSDLELLVHSQVGYIAAQKTMQADTKRNT